MRTNLLHRRTHPGGRAHQDHRLDDALRRSGRVPLPRAEAVPEPVAEVGPDAERVREAIRGSSRRTVVRTAVWSVPVIAAATAAPAFAVSPPFCATCNGTSPPQCLLSGTGGGTGSCQCTAGLVCVGTGPLGLANVCVGTTIISTTCGGGTCFGVCLTTGGPVLGAVDTFVNGLQVALNLLPANCNATVTGGLPSNICATPVTAGGVGALGALCTVNTATGLVAGTVAALLNTLTTTLNALNVGVATSCGSGYTCRAGVRATAARNNGTACGVAGVVGTLDLTLGFCQC